MPRKTTGGINPVVTLCMLMVLAVLSAVPAAAGDRDAAERINKRGFVEYQVGNYREAVRLFEEAIDADPTYMFARYNLAGAFTLMIGEDHCRNIGRIPRIFRLLETVVENEPGYADVLACDPAFGFLHRFFSFHRLAGRSVGRPDDVRAILRSVRWGAPAPEGTVRTGEDAWTGEADAVLIFEEEAVRYAAGADRDGRRTGSDPSGAVAGRYRVVTREAGAGSGGGSGSGAGSAAGSSGPGPAIEITFERPVRGRRLFQGDLSEDGVLAFEGLGRFVTFHDDCRD